jgi:hypothetical protein
MSADNISKLRINYDVWNAEGMTDENSLANALLTQPDTLSPVLTHLAGREDKRFPLSFLTEGVGNFASTKSINDVEFDWPVMGRINKAVQCVGLQGTGLGRTTFYLTFTDKWFTREYFIEPGDRSFQAKIVAEPYEGTGGWVYPCVLNTTDPTDTVTSAGVVGKKFVQTYAAVTPYGGSRGNESNWVAPSKMRNQTQLLRKSYAYEGIAPNRTVNITLTTGSGTTTKWGDFEEWQHYLRWKEELELAYWYSKYNRDSAGAVHLKDLSSHKQVTTSSGVLEQIPNVESYSYLTANKLKNVVRDTLYGASDAQKMNIVLYTGIGGMEEFDKAMKDDLASMTYVKTSPTFVTGSGKTMSLGGFFTSYQHIDGHTITARHLPLFDNGPMALASEVHPVTGLPLESYRMIFLDMSVYDGEPNIYMVRQKGREFSRWVVAGATIPNGFTGNALRASDIDGASVHFMQGSGIAIRRATNCMHLYCSLS